MFNEKGGHKDRPKKLFEIVGKWVG